MATLRQIADDVLALEDMLAELGGDVSDEEVDAAITRWMEENQHNLDNKLDGYCTLITQWDDRGQARLDEAKRLIELGRMDHARRDRLKERLLWFLTQHPVGQQKVGFNGKIKVETDFHQIAVQKNGGKTPVQIKPYHYPETEYLEGDHPEFVRVRYEWDMDAIRAYLEKGGTLPFATLGERGVHLRIK